MTQKIIVCIIALLTAVMLLMGCASVPETVQATPSKTAQPTASQLLATPEATTAQTESLSYVSIDVNPSIRLTIKDGVVAEVQAFNDDGESIALSYQVAGLSPSEAVSTLVNGFASEGYITAEEENSLVITACGDDEEELLQTMEDAAAQSVSDLGIKCDVVVSGVENETVDIAKENGLTPGRYLLLNYMAEKDGITLEEAKQKYGTLKMGKLVKLVDHVDDVFGHKGEKLIDSGILTDAQKQILLKAQNEFKAAMKQAQQLFQQTKTQARVEIKAAKTDIQKAYKADKDKAQYKSAKTELQQQLSLRKQEARQVFFEAKTKAQEQFRAAVASLGLTSEQLEALTEWDDDLDWDIDDIADMDDDGDEDIQEDAKDVKEQDINDGTDKDDMGDDDNDDVDDDDDRDDGADDKGDDLKPVKSPPQNGRQKRD